MRLIQESQLPDVYARYWLRRKKRALFVIGNITPWLASGSSITGAITWLQFGLIANILF